MRHTLAVGDQLDMRATVPDEYDWPESRLLPVPAGGRLTVVIDGTYVRDSSGWSRQHNIIAGRIERDGHLGGHFAWVAGESTSSRELMKAALNDHGWTEQSRVTIFAYGADGLKSLVQEAISGDQVRTTG
jgi:NADPH-dependent ferric siderophore reductase